MALIEKSQRGEGGYDFFSFNYEWYYLLCTVLSLRPLLIILNTTATKYAYLYVEIIVLIAFYV